VNHYVSEEDPSSVRRNLRANARRLGVLAESHVPRRVLSQVERQAALDSARGLGQVVGAIFEDGR